MSAETIELLNRFLDVALFAVVGAMVLCVVLAVWMTRRRHKSYEDYLGAKRNIKQGTAIVPKGKFLPMSRRQKLK